MSRLTIRSDRVEQTILSRLATGEPLAVICRENGMPDPSTWRDWCNGDQSLAIAYARAREDGEDYLAAQCLAIMDEEPARYETENGDRIDPGFVAHQKNRVEGRLKLLAKWNPKRWGDKVDVTSDGRPIGEISETERAARVAGMLAEAAARRSIDNAGE